MSDSIGEEETEWGAMTTSPPQVLKGNIDNNNSEDEVNNNNDDDQATVIPKIDPNNWQPVKPKMGEDSSMVKKIT